MTDAGVARLMADFRKGPAVRLAEDALQDCVEETFVSRRLTLGEWAVLVETATVKAWKRTDEAASYTTLYRTVNEALRHAMPDEAPLDGSNA